MEPVLSVDACCSEASARAASGIQGETAVFVCSVFVLLCSAGSVKERVSGVPACLRLQGSGFKQAHGGSFGSFQVLMMIKEQQNTTKFCRQRTAPSNCYLRYLTPLSTQDE